MTPLDLAPYNLCSLGSWEPTKPSALDPPLLHE